MNTKPLPEFDSIQEAQVWMDEMVDDPCVDGGRLALLADEYAMDEYWKIHAEGCCGFFDEVVLIKGETYMIGCNYGH